MASFHFMHAADLLLDSPLVGLAGKSQDRAACVDDASGRAIDNLVALATEEDCRLIVITGDVFGGQWRDYRTDLLFVDPMRRPREAGTRVIMIAGNHDAENCFAARLEYSDNVRLLSAKRPDPAPTTLTIRIVKWELSGRPSPESHATQGYLW